MIPAGTVLPISLYCPPMKVHMITLGLHQTDPEPMIATIQMLDGSNLIIQNVVIPKTYVRRQSMLHWLVDTCIGEGNDGNGNIVSVTLDPELVTWSMKNLTMVALPVSAKGLLTLSSGQIGQISVLFPLCKD